MALGMGIWDGDLARYYPYDEVVENGNAVLDSCGGRQVVVYLDPSSYSLAAAYADAEGLRWNEKTM